MYGTIVLAVDEFEHSDAAAKATGALAKVTDDEVFVLHVFQVHVGKPAPASYLTREEAQALVDRHVEALTASGVKAKGHLEDHLSGTIGHVVAEVVQANGAGLVVTGTRGRSELAALALGSASHDIVRASAVPVLVVPGRDA